MINKISRLYFVRNIFITGIVIVAALMLFSSCKVYKPNYYFKDITRDTIIKGFKAPDLELKIKKNDLLQVAVTSLNGAEDALYNQGAVGAEKGFRVDSAGNIYIHKLGGVMVADLTRQQLKDKLEKGLLPYLKDPLVTVSFLNHHVTVFGETGSQVVEMPDTKIPLLEVMARANPVTLNSQLSKVMIIRELDGAKQFKHINLEDPSIFSSSWYYLQPDDMVVVKPNAEKVLAEAKRTRNQLLYTTVLTAITFVFLIIDRVFR